MKSNKICTVVRMISELFVIGRKFLKSHQIMLLQLPLYHAVCTTVTRKSASICFFIINDTAFLCFFRSRGPEKKCSTRISELHCW